MDSLNSEHVVAHAAQQLTTYTDGLCNNVDVWCWWKVVDVVWHELTLVRGVAKDLPASFVMPTSLMATDQFMLDPDTVHKTKEWPKWDVIRNSKDEDFVDHPWYKIRDQVPEGRVCMPDTVGTEPVDARMDDGESVQGETSHGRTDSHAVDGLSTQGRAKSRRRSKSVKSTATVDSDDGAPATSSTHTDDRSPSAEGFVPAPDDARCSQCSRANRACLVKSGQACWSCHHAKTGCSVSGHGRGRSRSWAPQHRRRSASPGPAEAHPPNTPWASKRRRAPSKAPTPGPSTAATPKAPRASKKKPPTWAPNRPSGTSSVPSTDHLESTDADSPAMTYVERLVQVEEEIFIVHREHAVSLTQLANQREQIDSLTLIVEELRKVVANLSPMTPAPGPQDTLSFPTQPTQLSGQSPTPLALASTTVLEEVRTSATTSWLPSPAPPPPIDAPPPVTSAIPETCWDLVLASWMPAISITPPVDSPNMETQLEGDDNVYFGMYFL
ncbi:hypothetical protein SCLCIDRAFT_33641 [Scleroderma citrinum Foug A]|uniref:Uncharacterized protein n=1 Tax=Scleroderma citrinum Foug A TaxID=1036808 RepID=A0A0C3CRH4_9AGAM|nr:hypothetical protein SCLCIDRAFT_33641 [Scleroderma citrinum Foug A]